MYLKAFNCLRIILLQLVVVIISTGFSFGQQTTQGEAETTKKLEDVVVNDMLRIVDHKFDTLTTRITALERAVSGLQFYSIRQFRQTGGQIQKTQNGITSVGKKVSQLETDGRGLKIAMSLLGRDVSELKSTTTDLLSELESSVVYINDNVDKQALLLKNTVAETSNQIVKATDELLVRQSEEEELKAQTKEASKPNQTMNCSVELSNFRERFDVRLADFKQELLSQCFGPLANIQSQIKKGYAKGNNNASQQSQHKQNGLSKNKDSSRATKEENQNTKTIKMSPQNTDDDSSENPEVSHFKRESEDIEYYDDYEEKMMNLLVNMTTSVLQASSYFRQSGGLLEEIMANTDTLAKGQAILKQDLQNLLLGPASNTVRGIPLSNEIPNEVGGDLRNIEHFNKVETNVRSSGLYKKSIPVEKSEPVNCGLPSSVVKGLMIFTKNGSQLLEILTDLAHISSMSLAKTTGSLHKEIQKLEEVRTKLASRLSSEMNEDENSDLSLEVLKNSTMRIIQVVESNTGWLRLIYRNNQQVEKIANRSLSMTSRNNQILHKTNKNKLKSTEASKEIAKLREANEILQGERDEGVGITEPVTRSKDDDVLDRNSLETIYSTSQQLNRIMPALTRLLAEPDPLFTLVGGGDTDRGRLEIYNNGQWGTICHSDLTNHEADVVCRHLGFKGGFSAGSGHFGPGTGVALTLNVSCLESEFICTSVKFLSDMTLCNHENDAAIVCDHVLRIVPDNETISNKIGRLEIMHQGFWLPVCGEGWSGFSARVACKQMDFVDGRELVQEPWLDGANSTWLSKVACNGDEPYLDECQMDGWSDVCANSIPAGVRCL